MKCVAVHVASLRVSFVVCWHWHGSGERERESESAKEPLNHLNCLLKLFWIITEQCSRHAFDSTRLLLHHNPHHAPRPCRERETSPRPSDITTRQAQPGGMRHCQLFASLHFQCQCIFLVSILSLRLVLEHKCCIYCSARTACGISGALRKD